jgi:hypothetical protein
MTRSLNAPALSAPSARSRWAVSDHSKRREIRATIATLNTAESGYPANIHSIASTSLNKLVPWEGNVRKTGWEDGLGKFTALIAAHGDLQSFMVCKANRGKYSIIAGRRRYLALSALAQDR